ncbi:hypothetical protein F5Y10DRAFT_270470 [Nemania abortiva]|nr:hypothetical protein F5Y10DRAFT_270470 [Nemania abortiva]
MPALSKRSAETGAHDGEPTPKKSRPSAKTKSVGMCSLSKKEFGDKIKHCLRLEKYEVSRTLIKMDMDLEFFRNFFGGVDGIGMTPTDIEWRSNHSLSDYDDSTPVVVAQLSSAAASEVFGVTKTRNGNRYKTVYLAGMVVIFYPDRKRAHVWVTA